MSGLTEDLPRRLFVASLSLALLGGAFAYGALASRYDLPPIPQLKTVRSIFTDQELTLAPKFKHMQPSRGQGEGVTVNELPDDDSLVFMAGFFDDENQIRLVNRNGDVVKRWSLNYLEHFAGTQDPVCDVTDPLDVDIHGALATPSGEVVFNYEYCGTVKLDQCGEVLWTINQPTHHSLTYAESGDYWILGRYVWKASESPDRFPPFSSPGTDQMMSEDTLMRVSADGNILEEVSIPVLLQESGLEPLLTANGKHFNLRTVTTMELIHANKIAELPSGIADRYPLFSAGDLLISMRELNLIVVLDSQTRKVKWHQTGPWIRQHDPEFRTDGRISIFNNNVYRTSYRNNQTILTRPHKTNILVVDPVTRATEVVYGEQTGQEMLSIVRGQHELLDTGGMLITEFDAGRVLQIDHNKQTVWEYINRYDDDHVGELTNSAVYPADYFQEEWKTCSP